MFFINSCHLLPRKNCFVQYDFLKLSNFYDLVLLSRTPFPKMYPPLIENKNSDCPKEHFLENAFPQQKGDMWRTLRKHFHNFLINHLFLSQLTFWISKLWLITYVQKLSITINQLQKMIDHSKHLNGNQALLKCKGHMTVELH